jgi:DNA-binding response OmpR family regulator
VYLPAAPEHQPEPIVPTSLPIPRGHGELVLIVDDENNIRNSIRLALETAGYRTLAAADGIAALTHYSNHSRDIAAVLTDLMMPSMDGITLIRAVRAMAPSVPIIASTGLGERTHVAQLSALGVETILYKPFNARSLLLTMNAVLCPADH